MPEPIASPMPRPHSGSNAIKASPTVTHPSDMAKRWRLERASNPVQRRCAIATAANAHADRVRGAVVELVQQERGPFAIALGQQVGIGKEQGDTCAVRNAHRVPPAQGRGLDQGCLGRAGIPMPRSIIAHRNTNQMVDPMARPAGRKGSACGPAGRGNDPACTTRRTPRSGIKRERPGTSVPLRRNETAARGGRCAGVARLLEQGTVEGLAVDAPAPSVRAERARPLRGGRLPPGGRNAGARRGPFLLFDLDAEPEQERAERRIQGLADAEVGKVARLDHRDARAALRQADRAGSAGRPAADDEDVEVERDVRTHAIR